jgi:hypothetical protein
MGTHARHLEPATTTLDPEPIVLRKGARVWRFVWTPAEVPILIQTLAEMAENDVIDLDWSDAAVVVYELGRRLETIQPRRFAAQDRSEATP